MLITTKCECGEEIKTDTLGKQKWGAEYSNLCLVLDQEVSVMCNECGNVVTLDNDAKETIAIKVEQIECVQDFGLNDTHQELQEHADKVYVAAEIATKQGIEIYEQDQPLGLKNKLRNFLKSYNKCVECYGVEVVLEFIDNDIQANY